MRARLQLLAMLALPVAGLRTSPATFAVGTVARTRLSIRAMVGPQPRDKNAGFYARPSAVVEKGGAFYVPGLEGYRLKLLAAAVLLISLAANRVLSPGNPAGSQLVSEVLGAMACALLLVQVVAEIESERASGREAERALASARNAERTELDSSLPAERSDRLQWAAATLLRLTPASIISIYSLDDSAGEATPLLRSGRLPAKTASPKTRALIEQLAPDGRGVRYFADAAPVAGVLQLPPTAGCAIMARCGDDCVLVAVSELSAGFDDDQCRWIGKIAELLA